MISLAVQMLCVVVALVSLRYAVVRRREGKLYVATMFLLAVLSLIFMLGAPRFMGVAL